MGYLEKEFILHKRGEDGNLLSVDYFIKEFNAEVSVLPVTRGESIELGMKTIEREKIINTQAKLIEKLKEGRKNTDKEESIKEIDEKIALIENKIEDINKERYRSTEDYILKHILKPKFTREELADAKVIILENGKKSNIIEFLMKAVHEASGIKLSVNEEEEELKKKSTT